MSHTYERKFVLKHVAALFKRILLLYVSSLGKRKLHDDCRIIARRNIECKVLRINVLACENAYSILAVLRFDKI